VDGERALITIRARDPERGRADVPGGFLHPGEHPIDGLKREVKEELGIDIDTSEEDLVSATPHRYGRDGDWVLSLGFKGRLTSGQPAPADDVAEARWIRLNELEKIDFAWPHDRELVRRALEHG
jgi:ADP-ribose pyrophosphatase YjhB (NUDIX family)